MGYTKIAGTPVITGLYTILIPIAAYALLGSSRHLVVGGDSATAAIMYAGIAGLGIAGLQPNTPQWVALASLSALLAGGLALPGADRAPRLPRQLPLAHRAGRLPHRRRRPGRDRAGRRHARHPGADVAPGALQRHPAQVRPDPLAHRRRVLADDARVSAAVLAILIVFGRWVKAIPGGLVAVVGMIALSWIFDFSAHDVSILGPVPSGLPHIGLPQDVSWRRRAPAARRRRSSMFIVILAQSAATSRAYAVKYGERFDENTDLVGLGVANLAAGLQQHVRRQRQPDQDRDGRRGEEPHPGRAAHDRGRRRDRAALPHEAAAVPARTRCSRRSSS